MGSHLTCSALREHQKVSSQIAEARSKEEKVSPSCAQPSVNPFTSHQKFLHTIESQYLDFARTQEHGELQGLESTSWGIALPFIKHVVFRWQHYRRANRQADKAFPVSSEETANGRSQSQKGSLRSTEDREAPVQGRQHVEIQVHSINVQTNHQSKCFSLEFQRCLTGN